MRSRVRGIGEEMATGVLLTALYLVLGGLACALVLHGRGVWALVATAVSPGDLLLAADTGASDTTAAAVLAVVAVAFASALLTWLATNDTTRALPRGVELAVPSVSALAVLALAATVSVSGEAELPLEDLGDSSDHAGIERV